MKIPGNNLKASAAARRTELLESGADLRERVAPIRKKAAKWHRRNWKRDLDRDE